MKFLVTLIWSLILSQVTFYLSSALTGSPYQPVSALILGVCVAVGVYFIQLFFIKGPKPLDHSEHH